MLHHTLTCSLAHKLTRFSPSAHTYTSSWYTHLFVHWYTHLFAGYHVPYLSILLIMTSLITRNCKTFSLDAAPSTHFIIHSFIYSFTRSLVAHSLTPAIYILPSSPSPTLQLNPSITFSLNPPHPLCSLIPQSLSPLIPLNHFVAHYTPGHSRTQASALTSHALTHSHLHTLTNTLASYTQLTSYTECSNTHAFTHSITHSVIRSLVSLPQ